MKAYESVLEKLRDTLSLGPFVLVGLGNADRADDGFGLELARRLKGRFPDRVFSEEERSIEGVVLDLVEREDIATVLFVDAVDFGDSPGELSVFDASDVEKFVPSFSTHKVPIALLMGMLIRRGKKPLLLGFQPVSLDVLGEMSPVATKVLDVLEEGLDGFLNSNLS